MDIKKEDTDMTRINREIVAEIIAKMPETKRQTLSKALDRNEILTSSRVLSGCTLTIYKEGFLVELEGTRCGFTVYANDNDGELEITRKPNENKLHKLYSEWQNMNEDDYRGF